MGNKGGTGAAKTMTRSLDNKYSCSTMLWTYLGMRPPSLPLLPTYTKPLHLCNVMLRRISLVAAMHLWDLCTEVRGDRWGAERCSLLLLVMLLLLLMVVVDVVVFFILPKTQIIKDGGGTDRQTCRCCLKTTQLG